MSMEKFHNVENTRKPSHNLWWQHTTTKHQPEHSGLTRNDTYYEVCNYIK